MPLSLCDSGDMSAPYPAPAPAPSGAFAGSVTQASSMNAPANIVGTPTPGDPYGYAPTTQSAALAGPSRFPGTEHVDVQAVFAGGGYTSPKPITNPIVRVALWFAVFGFIALGVATIVSMVLAIIGLVRSFSLPDNIGMRESIAILTYDVLLALGMLIIVYL
mgnify:FL=1